MIESPILSNIVKQPGAEFTSAEIMQQPVIWQTVFEYISQQKEKIRPFLEAAFKNSDNIIFTGAGSSAFIGLSLHGVYFRETGLLSQAVATTDIVSHPADYFDKEHSPLIISFARSGNSPESLAALQLADQYARSCYHLIITCDADGALAKIQTKGTKFLFVLPPEANDKSLAMTSSYSSMLLSAILMLHLDGLDKAHKQIEILGNQIKTLMAGDVSKVYALAGSGFTRAVFLGSGPLYGTATEAHLKLQELTNGQIICKADSYLGFRHGPKAVLNNHTLVVFFISANAKVRRYEFDLIRAIMLEYEKKTEKQQGKRSSLHGLLISPDKKTIVDLLDQDPTSDNQFSSILMDDNLAVDYWPISAIVAGQLLALFTSLQLGVKPDNPSLNGAISRVVKGVTIYQDGTDADTTDMLGPRPTCS